MFVKETVKKWYVDTVSAVSWKTKKSSPNLDVNSFGFDSLTEAREFIQNEIGKIFSDKSNRIEWVTWTSISVEVRLNRDSSSVEKVFKTYRMEIKESNSDGILKCAEIGW